MTIMTEGSPSWFDLGYPLLSDKDDVGKAAVEGQVIEYPQVVRSNEDPPISGQAFGNLSFMLFKEPRMFRGKPIYGYVKLRGNHNDDKSARFDAYRIIRTVDSKFQIRIAKVGVWVPITENDSVVQELYDVRENTEEKHIRDEAVKEREAEQRRLAREIKEAEEALKTKGDIYDKPESLEFYTMKRVTEMRLVESADAYKRKLEDINKLISETHVFLRTLEQNYPQYADEWLECYNAERRKTSLPDFVPNSTQFDQYDATSLEQLKSEFPEVYSKAMEKMSSYGGEPQEKAPGTNF